MRIAAISRRRNEAANALLFVALACLTIKSLQEIGGVRVLSLTLPFVLLCMFSYAPRELAVPRSVAAYAAFTCFMLPIVSIFRFGPSVVYSAYLICTVVSAIALILVATGKLRFSLEGLAAKYADAMTVMCVLSAFTFNEQWFGGYVIRTFSDFATFFGLQVSVGIPFLTGKHKNIKRLICVVALFFTFSRLSFVIALLVVAFQLYKENRAAFIRSIPAFAIIFGVVGATSDMATIMAQKLGNAFAAAAGSGADVEINPSDLGRLAYAATTLEALSDPVTIVLGHGIKTNHDIIGSQLDTTFWGLDPEMADATVHNVYLELLSDAGIVGVGGMGCFLAFAGISIYRRRGPASAEFLSFSAFTLSYFFEANYVSFFFQFFICYYLWVASAAAVPGRRVRGPARASPPRSPSLAHETTPAP